MGTPDIPLPYPPPEPDMAEVPTAAAELQILLFPTDLEFEIRPPIGQSKWPAGTARWIAQVTVAATLITGTLLGASPIHLHPAATTAVILAELIIVFGMAQFFRSSRHK